MTNPLMISSPGPTGARRCGTECGLPAAAFITTRDRDGARTEGIVLDPVYTGRASAGLIATAGRGDIRPGERMVFLHSGSLPGLLGHPDAASLAH